MKKRWFAASLAALMALSMTACGGGKAAETTAAPAETKAEETKAEESKAEEASKEENEDNSYYTDPLIDAAMEIFRARIISQ